MRPLHEGGEKERDWGRRFISAEEARSVVISVTSVFTERAVSQETIVEAELVGEGEADFADMF